MRWLALLVLSPTMALAEGCPSVPDQSARTAPLLAAVAAAPDPATAQALMSDLWAIWTEAPDSRSQELLDAGRARIVAHDYAGARGHLDALIGWCPAYAEGWNQRAYAFYLSGEYGQALDDLETALELSPDHIGVRSGLALTLMNLGRIEAGQAALREALKLNPWLAERALLIEPPGQTL